MPLLWCDDIVGWANARVEGSRLNVDVGFTRKRPPDADFRTALEAEIDRLRIFLDLVKHS
jgi:hypothetical protein